MDPQIVPVIAILGLLCVGGVILAVVLPFISGLLGAVSSVFELVIDLFTGGPVAWCGCLLALLLVATCCGLILFAVAVLPTCGTPDAVNFCAWFGLG